MPRRQPLEQQRERRARRSPRPGSGTSSRRRPRRTPRSRRCRRARRRARRREAAAVALDRARDLGARHERQLVARQVGVLARVGVGEVDARRARRGSSTSPSAGSGTGASSTSSSTSGPPHSLIRIARMRATRAQRLPRAGPSAPHVASPSSDPSPSTPSRPRRASATACSAAPPCTSRSPRRSSPRRAWSGPVGDDFGEEEYARPARPRRDHRRHRARRRAARRSSGPAATSATSTSATRCRPTSTSSSTSSPSSRTPRAAADVAVPGQHPARPAARGARAVRGRALHRAGLDEPVDRHRPRVAREDDRDGRLRDPQRRASSSSSPTSPTSSAPRAWCSTSGRASWSPSRASTARRCSRARASSALPAYPTEDVVDPTGAGDTFAGGFMGYVAAHADEELDDELLRRAMAYGTALASFNVEAFGTERMQTLTATRSPSAWPSCSASALRGDADPAARLVRETGLGAPRRAGVRSAPWAGRCSISSSP